ncbi:hypothetical protein C6B38_02270 [Spiroplasma sp. ChiS]|uniref:hypothetical protein n=1 Tax=Spiroplasma sp. ChiS TaxID=2099885 RepID=UPI000CF9D7D9|nr:hypothetical protein [Spiroplasma sp. ChiS]PQP79137.1 hypothetical protein C6B38_02270 [Spiroplasma sp. ChiS]
MRKSCSKCRSKIDGDDKYLWCSNDYCILAKKSYILRKKIMNISELIKYDKLKKELAEKDKEIKKLKSKHLFKEDFYLLCEEDKLTYDWEKVYKLMK